MRTTAVVLGLGLVVAGCGGGTVNMPSDAVTIVEMRPATDSEILRSTVQGHSDAFLTGDLGFVRATLTTRCRKVIGRAGLEAAVSSAAERYGTALEMETYDADESADSASISYTFAVAALDRTDEPWVRENGFWRNDAC